MLQLPSLPPLKPLGSCCNPNMSHHVPASRFMLSNPNMFAPYRDPVACHVGYYPRSIEIIYYERRLFGLQLMNVQIRCVQIDVAPTASPYFSPEGKKVGSIPKTSKENPNTSKIHQLYGPTGTPFPPERARRPVQSTSKPARCAGSSKSS